jgi:hypothetical protein
MMDIPSLEFKIAPLEIIFFLKWKCLRPHTATCIRWLSCARRMKSLLVARTNDGKITSRQKQQQQEQAFYIIDSIKYHVLYIIEFDRSSYVKIASLNPTPRENPFTFSTLQHPAWFGLFCQSWTEGIYLMIYLMKDLGL